MSKYTQSCIYSGYGIDTLTKIVTHCIRLIIDYLSKPEDSFVVDPYYSEGYTVWRSAFEADEKEKTNNEAKKINNETISNIIYNSINKSDPDNKMLPNGAEIEQINPNIIQTFYI